MLEKIPVLIKHSVLAVYESPYTKGRGSTRFWSAIDIIKAHLSKHGYLVSENDIKLTAKGRKADAKHVREPGSAKKNKKFDDLHAMAMRRSPRDF